MCENAENPHCICMRLIGVSVMRMLKDKKVAWLYKSLVCFMFVLFLWAKGLDPSI